MLASASVRRDHHEEAVDVQAVAGERARCSSSTPCDAEHLLDLARALLVDAGGEADHGGLRVDPGEAAAFERRPLPWMVRRIGHAERRERPRHRQLLAAADARAHAA